jgi:acetyl-CoA C-acetyltransferase
MAVSRKDMDLLALESHQRAGLAREKGLLNDIIVPIQVQGETVEADEGIRNSMSLKLLERMKPVFLNGGRITAGNTCLKHDGAAVVLLASGAAVEKYSLSPQAAVVGMASCGCDPNVFPLGPVYVIRRLLERTGFPLEAVDRMEINEAFAVKILACCRELGYSLNKTNTLGGALAYGHPYGASGAIILLHLIKALKYANGRYGIAAIGAVGGMGVATLIERC